MDPVRFDQLSKRLAARCSRRRAAQALGAAGLAGAGLSQRRQDAAADCPNASLHCGLPHSQGGYQDMGGVGHFGQCWDWSTFDCEMCPGTMDAAARRCNETYQDCLGRCIAVIHFKGRW
jgi:hypothetical protein